MHIHPHCDTIDHTIFILFLFYNVFLFQLSNYMYIFLKKKNHATVHRIFSISYENLYIKIFNFQIRMKRTSLNYSEKKKQT